jgi:hypothetical protein
MGEPYEEHEEYQWENRRKAPKKNGFFEGLMEGLKQAAAHATGEITLPVRYYDVTPPVDVKAIRTN